MRLLLPVSVLRLLLRLDSTAADAIVRIVGFRGKGGGVGNEL